MRVMCSTSLAKRQPVTGLTMLSVICALIFSSNTRAQALEPSPAATVQPSGEFSLEPDTKEHDKERKEIENLLQSIETQWNSHNLDSVMSNYADDYINNDGLDKKAVAALTQDFWKTYPDAKSSSKTKQIRIEGGFATVESRDMALGSTAKEMPGIGTKGELSSISEGQLYIKKIGNQWKIIGDRIDYEKVRVAFGNAKNLNPSFSAPEQVKSGRQYSAKLELSLPQGLTAVGSITSQPLEYPQPQPSDAWRPLEGPVLERIMGANTNNRNELLMATIGITNSSRNNLMGIEFLTRRLNVVPNTEEKAGEKTAEKKEKGKEKAEAKPGTESKTEEVKPDEKSESKKEDESKPKSDSSQKKDEGAEKVTKPGDDSDKSADKDDDKSDKSPQSAKSKSKKKDKR